MRLYIIRKSEEAERIAYDERIKTLSDQLLVVVECGYFIARHGDLMVLIPRVWQQTLATRVNKRGRKVRSEDRKQAREEEKRKAREAKRAEKRAANPQPQPLLTARAERSGRVRVSTTACKCARSLKSASPPNWTSAGSSGCTRAKRSARRAIWSISSARSGRMGRGQRQVRGAGSTGAAGSCKISESGTPASAAGLHGVGNAASSIRADFETSNGKTSGGTDALKRYFLLLQIPAIMLEEA